MKTYIGIDNGVTGSIAAIHENGKTPVFLQQDYAEKKQNLIVISSARFCHRTGAFVLLERHNQYIDSKEWQKFFFPKGYEKGETKRFSAEASSRLFPHFFEKIKKQKNGDALLIAEYAKRRGGKNGICRNVID